MFDYMPALEDILGFREIVEQTLDHWDMTTEYAKLMASTGDLERAESALG